MALQNPTISAGSVLRLAIGGAIGGLIAYYLLDPGMREVENGGLQNDTEALYLGLIIGAAIGTMLILADEIQSPKPLRLTRNLLLGAFVGALVGTIGVFCADIVFDPLARTRILPLVIIGRVAGWAIMGAAAGLCPGVVAGSMVRMRQGVLGGILGGALGGVLFDVIAAMTNGGSASRMVGFTITGLAIGVAVGLIEQFKKVYWLTILTGGREGRNYILTRPTNVLGRDELVDVPLFGDSSIETQHASFVLAPSGATLITRPGATALVNGANMSQIALQDGDIMEFGRHRIRFHQRSDAGLAPQTAQTDLRAYTQSNQGYYGQQTALPAGLPTNFGVSQVTVVQGSA